MNHTFYVTHSGCDHDPITYGIFANYYLTHREQFSFQLALVKETVNAYIIRVVDKEDQHHIDNLSKVLSIYKKEFVFVYEYDYWEDKVKGT